MKPRADRVLKLGRTANTSTVKPRVWSNSTRRIYNNTSDNNTSTVRAGV